VTCIDVSGRFLEQEGDQKLRYERDRELFMWVSSVKNIY